MELSAKDKVAQYLGRTSETRYETLEVREWAHVYWVHIYGRRPTMLSKKLVDRAAFLRIGYTVAGDYLVNDQKTSKFYIIRKPGMYGTGEFSLREIESSQVSRQADFSDFYNTPAVSCFYSKKPQNLRQLMVLKAVANV